MTSDDEVTRKRGASFDYLIQAFAPCKSIYILYSIFTYSAIYDGCNEK